MSYPTANNAQVAEFRDRGFLVVRDAIPQGELDVLESHCDTLIRDKERLANDWAWQVGEDRDKRSFKIVQSSPSYVWPEIGVQPYRRWLAGFSSALMGLDMAFWYDQFLGKPPGASARAEWHQDEGYWGRNLDDRGVTGWIPLQAVDPVNGCMHFVERAHRDGMLPHRGVPGVQSDLLVCNVDETRAIACPMARGDVAFHHSKTPHMSTANHGSAWRKAVTNHLQARGSGGEGGHYPWRVKVNQRSGERRNVGAPGSNGTRDGQDG